MLWQGKWEEGKSRLDIIWDLFSSSGHVDSTERTSLNNRDWELTEEEEEEV